jgi:hypothetical protein
MLIPQELNELWLFHREEMETIQDGVCDLYVILDAVSKHCISFNTSNDLPSIPQVNSIIKEALTKYQAIPRKMAI